MYGGIIQVQNIWFDTNVIQQFHMLCYSHMMNGLTLKSEIQTKQEENVEKEKEKTQEQDGQQTIKNNLKKEICYIYPGQSKNYYKNMGQKIANFILQEFSEYDDLIQEPQIKKFLKIDNQKFNRNSIQCLIKSQKGREICRLFFAQYKWVKPLVISNKTDLDLNFRYNRLFYQKQKSTLKKVAFQDFKIKEES